MPFRAVTVTTGVTPVVSYNPNRVSIVIRNNAAQQCFISEDQTVVTTQGFPLNQNDIMVLAATDGDDTVAPMFGQVSANTADLRIEESFYLGGPQALLAAIGGHK